MIGWLDMLDRLTHGLVKFSKNATYNIVNESTPYILIMALTNMYENFPQLTNFSLLDIGWIQR